MLLTKTTEIFVRVDDFCLEFEKEFKRLSLEQGEKSRTRRAGQGKGRQVFANPR
jgi:hypothetical protein